jgi:hypothetical protein
MDDTLTCARCNSVKKRVAFGKLWSNRLADICQDCKRLNYWRSEGLSTDLRRAFHGKLSVEKTQDLIGCSTEDLRNYLHSQFEPTMTWENYGKKGWHLDHIAPCAAFNLSDPLQVKLCYHYTNLRPVWATDNHKKSGKITSEGLQILRAAGLVNSCLTA